MGEYVQGPNSCLQPETAQQAAAELQTQQTMQLHYTPYTFATSYTYSPGDKMWGCSTKFICCASHIALCCIHVYQPMDHWSIWYYSLLHFCVSYNGFCSHEPSSSAPYLHTSNKTHDVCPFCKHLKASPPINVDRISIISDFRYVALYTLYVHIKMPSL